VCQSIKIEKSRNLKRLETGERDTNSTVKGASWPGRRRGGKCTEGRPMRLRSATEKIRRGRFRGPRPTRGSSPSMKEQKIINRCELAPSFLCPVLAPWRAMKPDRDFSTGEKKKLSWGKGIIGKGLSSRNLDGVKRGETSRVQTKPRDGRRKMSPKSKSELPNKSYGGRFILRLSGKEWGELIEAPRSKGDL